MVVTKAARIGRMLLLTAGAAAIATAASAQTVPDPDNAALAASLDLPANLKIFGKADPNIRKATALVNNAVITGTDVDQRVAIIIGMNDLKLKDAEREQLRFTVLRQLIDETLQIQEAKSNDITIEPKEIDQTFTRVSKQQSKTPDQFRTWLRQVGGSERSLKRQIEGEMAWSRVLRRKVDINISEAEAQDFIDRMTASKGTEEVHVYEIYQNATPDRAQEIAAGMQRMIQQMREGTPFDYLARTYSQSSTAGVGGDLGWVRPAMLPDKLAIAAKEMQAGQVAGPIELPTGFSILYLAERRQMMMPDPKLSKLSLRQLTITFPKGATEAQAQARAGEFAKATQAMKGCGDAANIAAAQNADVVEREGIVIGDLPAALQTMVMPLQIGQSTVPFGTVEDGVRVLVICGRDDPPMPGLPTLEQVQEKLADDRTNIRAQRMLRDLRRDALVEYR